MSAVQAFKNTRLAPRYKFKNRESCESKLIDKTSMSESVISTVDLSPSGIAFLSSTEMPFKSGETVLIEISPFGSQPIRSFVKIIRTQNISGATLYGAQFVALPLLHQERLDKLIRTAHFNQQIEEYVDDRDLRIRINSTDLIKKMAWIAVVLTAIYAQMRIFNLL